MAISRGYVTFLLEDENGTRLKVEVELCGGTLNLSPEGFGNQVSLDFAAGELRLLTNLDPDDDEPVITTLVPMPDEE